MQMSTVLSRRAKIYRKGNHRRILREGISGIWGCRKDLQHSFARRGAITFDMIRM